MIKILLKAVSIFVFAGTLFYLFQWDIALAFMLLLGLVTTQVLILKKRTKNITLSRQKISAQAALEKITHQIKQANETAVTKNKVGKPVFDSKVFKQFNENLQKKETGDLTPPTQEKEVIVSISQKTKQIQEKVSLMSDAETQIGGLYDDVHEQLDSTLGNKKSINKRKPSVAEMKENTIQKEAPKETQKNTSALTDSSEAQKQQSTSPPKAKEFLTTEDIEASEEKSAKESLQFLEKIREFWKAKKFEEGINHVNRWLKLFKEGRKVQDHEWEILLFKGKMEFELKQYQLAAGTFQLMCDQFLYPQHPSYENALEDTLVLFRSAKQTEKIFPLCLRMLKIHKNKQNHSKMDEIYKDLELIYIHKKDWKQLLQVYQGHLSVKRVLKDDEGQLELLDRMGKLYYDQGDKTGSKTCYEESIKIKRQKLEETEQIRL